MNNSAQTRGGQQPLRSGRAASPQRTSVEFEAQLPKTMSATAPAPPAQQLLRRNFTTSDVRLSGKKRRASSNIPCPQVRKKKRYATGFLETLGIRKRIATKCPRSLWLYMKDAYQRHGARTSATSKEQLNCEVGDNDSI